MNDWKVPDVGAVCEAETSISSLEDDENDFFFSENKTTASELQLFLESNNDELSAYARWPNCASFSLN